MSTSYLTELREKAGYSQTALSELVGCTQGHLSRIESGERGVGSTLLFALADALGVEPRKLLDTIPPRQDQSRHPKAGPDSGEQVELDEAA